MGSATAIFVHSFSGSSCNNNPTIPLPARNYGTPMKPITILRVTCLATSRMNAGRLDLSGTLTLDKIRESLIRQEDSIIFNLLERAQYRFNAPTYEKSVFNGSPVALLLTETEKLHSKLGRYNSPDEYAFFPDEMEDPILPPMQYPEILHTAAANINMNQEIWKMYFDRLLPGLVAEGDDGNYGSTALRDSSCLQALSKRIHYGKFVAEAKFQDCPEEYKPAILAQDREALMDLVTFENVEAMVQKRVELKAKTYGQEINVDDGAAVNPTYKIKPSLVASLYANWVMPLTKKIQVEYLLRRLD